MNLPCTGAIKTPRGWTRSCRVVLATALCAVSASACGSSRGPSKQTNSAGDTLAVVQRVEHLGALAREPMVVEHPDGTLFVAGYSGAPDARPELWKSTDHGATWSRVDVGTEAQGAVGNSDVDLAVGPKGTVYLVEMDYDRKTSEGRGVAVGVSSDVGATWSWTSLSRTQFDDRPWVAVATDGTAHVIWNDGHGVAHAVSTDGGKTWTQLARVNDLGGSSHLALGPTGDIAVRVGPVSASGNRKDPGVNLVAVSTHGGRNWEKHAPPRQQAWARNPFAVDTIPRWVEPLAWDAAGRLYDLWTDSTGVWLSRSPDLGATWISWRVAQQPPHRLAFFPYLIARGRGELAATWFTGNFDPARIGPDSLPVRIEATLHWQAVLITVGDAGAEPMVTPSSPLPIDARFSMVVHGDTVRVPDTGGEYLGLAFLHAGGLAVVTPIQDVGAHRMGFTFWRFAALGHQPHR